MHHTLEISDELYLLESIIRTATTTKELKLALTRLNKIGRSNPDGVPSQIVRARYHMLRGLVHSKGASLPVHDWVSSRADSLASAELQFAKALDAIDDPLLDNIEGVRELRAICTFEAKVVESRLPSNGRIAKVSHRTEPLSTQDRSTVERCLRQGHVLTSRFASRS